VNFLPVLYIYFHNLFKFRKQVLIPLKPENYLSLYSMIEEMAGGKARQGEGKGNDLVTVQIQILNSKGKLLLGNHTLCRLKHICLNCLTSLALFKEQFSLMMKTQKATGKPLRI